MTATEIANSPALWIGCAIPVIWVIIQALLFAKKAYQSGEKVGLSKTQMHTAIKSAAITSIGPSLVVLSGMLSLLVTVGGAIGWMRLSMIGSVMFESIAAGLGTSAVGVTLGTDPMTTEALGMALWTMILCSVGWVLFSTFAADKMDKIEHKLSKGNAGLLSSVASCAIIGVFAAMCASHLSKPLYNLALSADSATMNSSWHNALACVLGAIIMAILTIVANKKDIGWLREWSLAITIVGAMIITALV